MRTTRIMHALAAFSALFPGRNGRLFSRRVGSALLALMFCGLAARVRANTDLTVGKPDAKGTVTITIYDSDGKVKKVTQVQVVKDERPEDKAADIAGHLKAIGVDNEVNGNLVIIAEDNVGIDPGKTGEKDGLTDSMALAMAISEQGPLAGQDSSGNPSIFGAFFGFDEGPNHIQAAVMLPYQPMYGVDANQLLIDMFNQMRVQLPPPLQPLLWMDLNGQRIGFNYPNDARNGFVQTFSTDMNAGIGMQQAARPGRSVSGTVALPGCVNLAQPLQFVLRPADASAPIPLTRLLDANGAFQLNNIPPGLYSLAIKGSKWLQKVVTVDTTGGDVSGVSTTLPPGDINGDNVVNILDLGLLADAFGSDPSSAKWNPDADLNDDGTVNISDLGLLADSFGKTGDP
jgi:hypothetical protein